MAYIGLSPQYGVFEKQTITADGSTTTFTLNYTVGSSSSILVSVAGVHQEPEVAYNLGSGGTQIVFTAAPAAIDTVFIIFLGVAFEVATFGTGVITGQTALTTGVQGADTLLIYDDSTSSLKKINLDDLITGQTELTSSADDDVLFVDLLLNLEGVAPLFCCCCCSVLLVSVFMIGCCCCCCDCCISCMRICLRKEDG